jgi:hypothetical protein
LSRRIGLEVSHDFSLGATIQTKALTSGYTAEGDGGADAVP